jgi:alanyl-tRNA synthetase
LFEKLAEHSKVGVYQGKVGEDDTTLRDTAYRAIADHARTLSFAIADGAVPNNEGRGYVLRRILRRATRYGQQILQAEPGFFQTLIPVVVETFGDAYPGLKKNKATILEIVAEEEEAFSRMLERGTF